MCWTVTVYEFTIAAYTTLCIYYLLREKWRHLGK